MPARLLRTIVAIAVCIFNGAFAFAGERPLDARASHQGSAASSRSVHAFRPPLRGPSLKRNAARTLAPDRDPYADPAAPYKANRLASRREPILHTPGQTTVLTRQVLDDMNATTLMDAMRSTAGVTVGR